MCIRESGPSKVCTYFWWQIFVYFLNSFGTITRSTKIGIPGIIIHLQYCVLCVIGFVAQIHFLCTCDHYIRHMPESTPILWESRHLQVLTALFFICTCISQSSIALCKNKPWGNFVRLIFPKTLDVNYKNVLTYRKQRTIGHTIIYVGVHQ